VAQPPVPSHVVELNSDTFNDKIASGPWLVKLYVNRDRRERARVNEKRKEKRKEKRRKREKEIVVCVLALTVAQPPVPLHVMELNSDTFIILSMIK
jgi:hypothetical protein